MSEGMLTVTPRTKSLASAILTATSWALWALALIIVKNSGVRFGAYGLGASLPVYFYAACALLSVAFIINLATPHVDRWRDALFISQIALLIAFLFVTPALIEPFPRFRTTYKVVGLTYLVISRGAVNPAESVLFNWPGAWALFSAVFQVALPSPDALSVFVKYYAPFMEVAYGLALYMLFRPFLSKTQTYLALFLFYIMNYVGQDYLSPQSVAYLLFLAFLVLIFVYVIRPAATRMRYPTVAISSLLFVIFLSLVVTHFLTSLALLLFFIIFAVSSRIVVKMRLNRFVVPYVVGFAGWMVFGSAAFFNYMLKRQSATPVSESISQGLQPGVAAGGVAGGVANASKVVGSVAHAFISNVGITWAVAVVCIIVVGLVYRYASSRKLDKTEAAYLVLLVGMTPILVLPGYSGELLFRFFLLILPALIYYLVKNVSFRAVKIAAVAILLFGPAVHVFVAYGNESFNYVSPAEISSYNFFYGTVRNASAYGGYPVSDYLHQENYTTKNMFQFFSLLNGGTLDDVGKAQLSREGPTYIFFTQGDDAIIRTLYAPQVDSYLNAKNVTTKTPFFNLIYSTSDVSLYQVRS
jgi:hypothetical protein